MLGRVVWWAIKKIMAAVWWPPTPPSKEMIGSIGSRSGQKRTSKKPGEIACCLVVT